MAQAEFLSTVASKCAYKGTGYVLSGRGLLGLSTPKSAPPSLEILGFSQELMVIAVASSAIPLVGVPCT